MMMMMMTMMMMMMTKFVRLHSHCLLLTMSKQDTISKQEFQFKREHQLPGVVGTGVVVGARVVGTEKKKRSTTLSLLKGHQISRSKNDKVIGKPHASVTETKIDRKQLKLKNKEMITKVLKGSN